ncbi:hypothetical protein chiPu_0032595 [Chiloscyllium punctatum]|uniref:Uncharacterized protein n=1 Tax=Chiloscyllium punctatum TaxID=137246 RepID=A0A401U1J0_CHIPU|nr:hypothetical protein [Chiloscyllium punctatum]
MERTRHSGSGCMAGERPGPRERLGDTGRGRIWIPVSQSGRVRPGRGAGELRWTRPLCPRGPLPGLRHTPGTFRKRREVLSS